MAFITCFGMGSSDAVVYCTDSNGHLIQLLTAGWIGSSGWWYADLTTLTTAGNNPNPILRQTPALLTGFAVGGSAPRVYFGGKSANGLEADFLVEFSWDGGDVFAANVLPVGKISHYLLTCFGLNEGTSSRVYYVDDWSSDVMELAFVSNNWVLNNVTSLAGAPPADSFGDLTGFALGVGGPDARVYYLRNGHVNELAVVGGNWVHSDITALARAPQSQGNSSLTCFGIGESSPRVYYLDPNSHVNELAWVGTGGSAHWVNTDVTAVAGASPAHFFSGLTGFAAGAFPRVYYLDSNSHVNELAWTIVVPQSSPPPPRGHGKWVNSDLTASAGAPASHNDGRLTCFGIGGLSPRVYYLDPNSHVNELAWVGAGGSAHWVNTDVTAVAGAPPVP